MKVSNGSRHLDARPRPERVRPLPRLHCRGGRLPDLRQEGPPQGGAGQVADGLHPGRDRDREVRPGQQPVADGQWSDRRERAPAGRGPAQSAHRQPAAQDARPRHLQGARCEHHRRALLVQQLRRHGDRAQHDAAPRHQRRRHRPRHRRLPACYQRSPPAARPQQEGRRPARRRLRRAKDSDSWLRGQAQEDDQGPQGRDQAHAGAGRPESQARAAGLLRADTQGRSQQPRPPRDRGHRAALPRRALRVGRRHPQRLRLLRPRPVLLCAGRHQHPPHRQRAAARQHTGAVQRSAPRRSHLLRQPVIQPPRGNLRGRNARSSRRRTPVPW